MRKFFTLVIAAALVLSLAACGSQGATETNTNGSAETAEETESAALPETQDEAEGNVIRVTVLNNTDTEWTSGYICAASNESWGMSAFGTTALAPNISQAVELNTSEDHTYDLRFLTEDGSEYIWQNVVIRNGDTIRVADGQDGVVLEIGEDAYLSSDSYIMGHSSLMNASGPAAGSVSNGIFTAQFTVENSGSETVWYLYSSASNASTWGPDLLEGAVLETGDTLELSADSEDETTLFDIMFCDADSNYWAYGPFDMSQITSFSVNLDDHTVEAFSGDVPLGTVSLTQQHPNG